jgi:hypothetical protein
VQKDLGMTLAEFNAAGALARRAADAVPSLRALPGYVGISLKGGKVVVEGSGAGLKARIDELNQLDDKNQATQADFVLAAPAAAATAASAPSSPERVAGSIEQLFQAYVREVGMVGLQAVAYTDGHFVIRTGGTNTPESVLPTVLDPQVPGTPSGTPSAVPGKVSPAEFVARYANVQLEKGAAIKTEQDFFGGQGYIIDGRTVCSAGFGAFSPAGGPLVLTAGHCAADGSAKQAMIEDPAGAPAAGGAGSGAAAGILGTFGFSQFGGPGNSKVAADGSNVGTDIAVLRGIRSGLRLQPAATRWDNPADPGPTSVKIVGTVAPFQGQAVCRSGRTTGWKCGTVDSVGIWVLPGSKNDLRAIRAFDSSSVKSLGGDSGGPWVSGNFAVGMHTGAEKLGDMQLRAIATTLEDAMTQIPGGVQLQLFLNKPELVTPANSGTVAAGELITGRVPAAPASEVAPKSKVLITVGTHELEVPVDAAGKWSFRAPLPAGQLAFSAETVNGYSHSGPVSFTATVVQAPAPLPAPGMTTPTDTPAQPGIPARAGIPAQPGGLAHPGNPAQPGTPAQSGSPGQPSSPAQMPTAQAPAAQAPVPPSDTTVTVDGSTPGGTSSGRADPLASMGASGLLPAAGLGAGALLLGAAFVVFARRRSVR